MARPPPAESNEDRTRASARIGRWGAQVRSVDFADGVQRQAAATA